MPNLSKDFPQSILKTETLTKAIFLMECYTVLLKKNKTKTQ